jgi:hypothetical protein
MVASAPEPGPLEQRFGSRNTCSFVVGRAGLEPATLGLRVRPSLYRYVQRVSGCASDVGLRKCGIPSGAVLSGDCRSVWLQPGCTALLPVLLPSYGLRCGPGAIFGPPLDPGELWREPVNGRARRLVFLRSPKPRRGTEDTPPGGCPPPHGSSGSSRPSTGRTLPWLHTDPKVESPAGGC